MGPAPTRSQVQRKIWVATCWPPVSGIRSVCVPINFYHGGLSLVRRGAPADFPILRFLRGGHRTPLSLCCVGQTYSYKGLIFASRGGGDPLPGSHYFVLWPCKLLLKNSLDPGIDPKSWKMFHLRWNLTWSWNRVGWIVSTLIGSYDVINTGVMTS